ncbi:MAG TPA: ABC transporter permease [Stellaceae bacterium]|nr:ABC transporter permease [Stellaceae bacterium]
MPTRRNPLRQLRELWPLIPACILLLLFYALPLLLLLPNSFATKNGWSGSIYVSVLGDSYYWIIIGRSFWIAGISTLLCLVLGYPVAYYLVRLVSSRFRRYAYMIVIAPLFTSAVIRAMAWVVILGRRGMLNEALLAADLVDSPLRILYSESAIVVGLVYIMIPFMVLTIAAVLENVDSTLEEAARDLGASPLVTFFKVTLPLTLPGVVAGAFLVFALSLSSYVTPALLGGGRLKVIATLIFEQFMRVFNWPLGTTIASVLLIIALLVIWAYNKALTHRFVAGRRGAAATL